MGADVVDDDDVDVDDDDDDKDVIVVVKVFTPFSPSPSLLFSV